MWVTCPQLRNPDVTRAATQSHGLSGMYVTLPALSAYGVQAAPFH